MIKAKETYLTPREQVILNLVGNGCSNKQIADCLFISIETVKNHLKNIYQKLDASNRIEALVKANMMHYHANV